MGVLRRQVLIGLAGATLAAASGCAASGSDAMLASALEELDALLIDVGSDSSDQLLEIAERISSQSHRLLSAHDEFASEFSRQAIDREVSDEALEDLVAAYDSDRLERRDRLIRTQDELRDLVPESAWPDVQKILNEKRRATAPRRARVS